MDRRKQLLPSWYWVKGLHDAVIDRIIITQIPLKIRDVYYNNCLRILLNADQAMFDRTIKEIRLYNCGGYDDILRCEGYWWINDNLEIINKKYMLTILLGNRLENKRISIRFTHCETIRG